MADCAGAKVRKGAAGSITERTVDYRGAAKVALVPGAHEAFQVDLGREAAHA